MTLCWSYKGGRFNLGKEERGGENCLRRKGKAVQGVEGMRVREGIINKIYII
jgi:hypothetical protein